MSITFEYEWQAVEFMCDCKRKSIVVVRDGSTIRFPSYKLDQVAELLLQACRQ